MNITSKTYDVLVVDLDHTLIDGDMMVLSIIHLLKHKPLSAFLVPFWLLKGKANLKEKLYQSVQLDIKKLKYNQSVIDYISNRKQQGNTIILATASHQKYADDIAKHLALFDEVYGTQNGVNLSSKNKAKFLVKQYGYYQFDYMGDHKRDIPVWQAGNLAIIIKPNQKLKQLTQNFHHIILE